MSTVNLIYPHQLFWPNPLLSLDNDNHNANPNIYLDTYLIEDPLFFTQYPFHLQKLVLHRASMTAYADKLQNHYESQIQDSALVTPPKIYHIYHHDKLAQTDQLLSHLADQGVTEIHVVEVDDYLLKHRLNRASDYGIRLHWYDSPLFLDNIDVHNKFFAKQKSSSPRYLHHEFYQLQRRRLNILMENNSDSHANLSNSKPIGGQWSFDADNRKKYPKDTQPPSWQWCVDDEIRIKARAQIATEFPNNYGRLYAVDEPNEPSAHHESQTNLDLLSSPQPLNASEPAALLANYPITHEQASAWLEGFLSTRFAQFGDYEDAIVSDHAYLHHSVLTPMLNIELITPAQVIKRTLNFAKNHNIPMNSLEGFIRQIIGWREFIRGLYHKVGLEQRNSNFWDFSRTLPKAFYTGETGLLPVDNVISRVLDTGYCHHIERLMVLGNIMLLCEIHPDGVYQWFMELFIDAYDWVMVPNVYGMSQFADGGVMATKPYISGSNYICKMSNYKALTKKQKLAWSKDKIIAATNSPESFAKMMAEPIEQRLPWQMIWDALFWRFMHTHCEFFMAQPRLAMLTNHLKRMSEDALAQHLTITNAYIDWLDNH